MHTGNLLGRIPSPLPSEVFADLVIPIRLKM